MAEEHIRRKKILFVDDEPEFLGTMRELFTQMSRGTWDVFTAENHAKALALLGRERVDLAVLDFQMPVMDGLQFLQLLRRAHPGVQVVMLTGHATPEARKASLEQGAALFLEKVISPDGFAAVYASLDALAEAHGQSQFRGVMRRVGLQEVVQMECLGRKSSVLEVFTGSVRGRIFICDGSIIHAELGKLQGEMALYSLLALPGGEFNLASFSEPPVRSIQGHYEFLLMEAARIKDETAAPPEQAPNPEQETGNADFGGVTAESRSMATEALGQPENRIEEVLLCSGAGELLYQSGCDSVEERKQLMGTLETHSAEVGNLLRIGQLERFSVQTIEGRLVCQLLPDRRLLVRTHRGVPLENA